VFIEGSVKLVMGLLIGRAAFSAHEMMVTAIDARQVTKSFRRIARRCWAPTFVATWISFLGICPVSLSNADEIKMLMSLITAAAESNPTAASQILFQTIAKGTRSGVSEAGQIIVRTQAEWNALWQKHSSMESNPSQAPAIDFNKEIVIGIFLGQKPTSGYDVEITSVERSDGTLTVSFREKSPQPGAVLTQAFTQPFHMVRIEINETPAVRFRRAP